MIIRWGEQGASARAQLGYNNKVTMTMIYWPARSFCSSSSNSPPRSSPLRGRLFVIVIVAVVLVGAEAEAEPEGEATAIATAMAKAGAKALVLHRFDGEEEARKTKAPT